MPFVVNKYLKREQGEWDGQEKEKQLRQTKTPQVLLKGPEALQFPSMAESSVLRLSPRNTAANTEAFLQTLCTQ